VAGATDSGGAGGSGGDAGSATTDGGTVTGGEPATAGDTGAGGSTTASGGSATASGGSTTASGGSTTASGGSTTASGGSTTASGGYTTASGGSTTASGGSTTASGGSAEAEGGSSAGEGGSADTGGSAGSAGNGEAGSPAPQGLGWPIDCDRGVDCSIGYPDIDGDGQAFDCGPPGYTGHQGTDISITWDMMDAGTDVYAADAGDVLWVFDGHFDRCPDAAEPECQEPTLEMSPGVESGYMVCTDAKDEYCLGTTYTTGCYWCFYGANVVVIRHPDGATAFATRYDHLRQGSIIVEPGQHVERGQKIAEVGSAGNSTGPHLHFEVWVGGFYVLAEPWAGTCGPNTDSPLWDPALGLTGR
jgi:murein DD-endopeptidase MepM/ murein hydrolase activator NlpD